MSGLRSPRRTVSRRYDLLKVGVAVYEGDGQATDWEDAIASVVAQIQKQRSNSTLPARGAILYASEDWCDRSRPLSSYILEQLAPALAEAKIPLIGGSSPGVFASVPAVRPEPFHIVQGFVLIVLFSEDLWMNVAAVDHPHEMHAEARQKALKKVAREIRQRREDHVGLGTSASMDLFAFFPGPYVNAAGERAFSDHTLHYELLSAFQDQYALFGGSTANHTERPDKGYQFIDDRCLESSLAIALLEHDFATGASMGHGLVPVKGMEAVVTELKDGAEYGMAVTSINGKPAREGLREIMAVSGFPSPRPVLGLGGGVNCHVVTPIEGSSRWQDVVLLNRNVYKGYRLAVLSGTNAEMKLASAEVIRQAWKRSGATTRSGRLVFGHGCIGRFTKYETESKDGWWRALKDICKTRGTPTVVALVAGEFGEDSRGRARGDNFSVWAAVLSTEPSHRALNRLLQSELLSSGDEVIACKSPTSVKRRAVKEAIRCGALGGMLLLVDKSQNWALGGEHAYAESRKPVNLGIAVKKTFRKLVPESLQLSSTLRAWSVPVGVQVPRKASRALKPEDDIVTIAAANRIAVFARDSQNPEFHCDRPLAKRAGVESLLVIPLVGSAGQLVGMFLLAMPSRVMNREEIRLWAGYGQMVASALERAVESDGRRISTRLLDIETEVLGAEIPGDDTRLERVRLYLTKLQELVGVDYVHARIVDQTEGSGRFTLVTTDDELAKRHAAERPAISRHEGSIANAIAAARRGCYLVLNNEREWQEMIRSRHPQEVTNEWAYSMDNFKTVVTLLIGSPDNPLGSIVFHSHNDFHFSGPLLESLLLVPGRLETLLAKAEVDQHARSFEELRKRVVRMASSRLAERHDAMRPLANLRKFLELVRIRLARGREISDLILDMDAQVMDALSVLMPPVSDRGEDEVVESVGDVLGRLCRRCGVSFKLDDGGVPAVIRMNPLLGRAFANLLTNAKEAVEEMNSRSQHAIVLPPVHVELLVRRQTVNERAMVQIRMENDGPKLNMKKLLILGQSTKKEHSGMGLSLAYVIIRDLGGHIHFRERPGGGLTVDILLPDLTPAETGNHK